MIFLNLKSTKNWKIINLVQDSGLNLQKIQPDLLNSISQIHQNQIQVLRISNLGSQIDSINSFLFKISRFLIPKFYSWTRFKFLISISKAA
ncbi:hypothetical protein IX84_31430 [Phaeodactylibacter xiamenensis]|uniref:Uncharacterized protein n=1 Tax=Phaeodactylibacter xiamenensis TaxID=1524460 RepID=A0A098S149_9BACT|nr:hypothetical protein IX84_31430 [Phaeodactylibacter xiamenensis]